MPGNGLCRTPGAGLISIGSPNRYGHGDEKSNQKTQQKEIEKTQQKEIDHHSHPPIPGCPSNVMIRTA
jgi:hypothetical protein